MDELASISRPTQASIAPLSSRAGPMYRTDPIVWLISTNTRAPILSAGVLANDILSEGKTVSMWGLFVDEKKLGGLPSLPSLVYDIYRDYSEHVKAIKQQQTTPTPIVLTQIKRFVIFDLRGRPFLSPEFIAGDPPLWLKLGEVMLDNSSRAARVFSYLADA